jgi:hypothetical protein
LSPRKTNLISLGVLLLGLGSAAAIYALAEPPDDDPLLADLHSNRKYKRELAVYGGRANVVSAEFIDWFGGLWHGRNLAGTVVVITAVVTLGFRFVASHPPGHTARPAPPDRS